MNPLVQFKNITKEYKTGGRFVQKVLKGISFEINKGDFISIMGPSGSGKSTCMNILGCLDQPTAGDFFLENKNISKLKKNELASLRNKTLGFVFQNFNLLAKRNLIDNVALPLVYRGLSNKIRKEKAISLLHKVNLKNFEKYFPPQLSGGMKQRVAIARALIGDPKIILADEPTGNLDTKTSHEIIKLFQDLNKNLGITIIMITHEADIASFGEKILYLRDGIIEKIEILKDKTKP